MRTMYVNCDVDSEITHYYVYYVCTLQLTSLSMSEVDLHEYAKCATSLVTFASIEPSRLNATLVLFVKIDFLATDDVIAQYCCATVVRNSPSCLSYRRQAAKLSKIVAILANFTGNNNRNFLQFFQVEKLKKIEFPENSLKNEKN